MSQTAEKENLAPKGEAPSEHWKANAQANKDVLGTLSILELDADMLALARAGEQCRLNGDTPCPEYVGKLHREQETFAMRRREREARTLMDGPAIDLTQFCMITIARVKQLPVEPQSPVDQSGNQQEQASSSSHDNAEPSSRSQQKRRRDDAADQDDARSNRPAKAARRTKRAATASSSTTPAVTVSTSSRSAVSARPFACTVPGCTSRFKRKGEWKRHTENFAHNAATGLTCQRCGKRLRSPRHDSLLRHYRSEECRRRTQEGIEEDSDVEDSDEEDLDEEDSDEED